jgi:hypothetical protein
LLFFPRCSGGFLFSLHFHLVFMFAICVRFNGLGTLERLSLEQTIESLHYLPSTSSSSIGPSHVPVVLFQLRFEVHAGIFIIAQLSSGKFDVEHQINEFTVTSMLCFGLRLGALNPDLLHTPSTTRSTNRLQQQHIHTCILTHITY